MNIYEKIGDAMIFYGKLLNSNGEDFPGEDFGWVRMGKIADKLTEWEGTHYREWING